MAEKRYRVLTGLNYPGGDGVEVRREAGKIVDDIPAKSLHWLLADGLVELVVDDAPHTKGGA